MQGLYTSLLFGQPFCCWCYGAEHVGISDVSGISTTRLVAGVISAMVENELGGKGTLVLTS